MHGWLSGGEYRAVLFERDSQPVAYALYRADADASIYLRQFFVAREHRRQGIGVAAIELLVGEICLRAAESPWKSFLTMNRDADSGRQRALRIFHHAGTPGETRCATETGEG